MRITIKAGDDNGSLEVFFTDEHLNNPNLIDMVILNEKDDLKTVEIRMPVKDMYRAIKVFEGIRKDAQEEQRYYDGLRSEHQGKKSTA